MSTPSYPLVGYGNGGADIVFADGTIRTFYAAENNQIWQLVYNNTTTATATVSVTSNGQISTTAVRNNSPVAAVTYANQIRVYYVASNNVLVELAWNGTAWVNGYSFPTSDYTVAETSNLLYARVTSDTGSIVDVHVGFQQPDSPAIVEAHYVGTTETWSLETLQ